MVMLQTVEIPGYAEAVRKEQRLRDTAFLGGLESVCDTLVLPLSLRRLIWLEQARNGLVGPFRFDTDEELLAHALQIVWFCRPEFKLPSKPRFSFWESLKNNIGQQLFFRRILRAGSPEGLINEVREWISDAFMDAPNGQGMDEVHPPSYASYPAYVVDKFAEAGLPFSYDEIMEMPLKRLWQHWRVGVRRLGDSPMSNPSDKIAVEYLARMRK